MASSVVGSLVVRLSAHTAAFSKGLKRARKTTGAFVTGVTKRFGGMFKKMLLSATVAAVGIAVLVKRQMAMIDTTTKTAVKLGIATKELSRWHYAAKLSGLATTTFDMALQRMVRRVAEAAQGTGEAQEAIKTLGVDAKKLNRLTPDKMLLALSDALGKIPSQGEQLRLYFKLFDSEGVKMKNVLGEGRDAIIAMLKEADKAGASFSKFDAATVEAANDAVTRMGASFSGLFTRLSVELSPFIKMLSDNLADGIIKAGDAAKNSEKQYSGLALAIFSIAEFAQGTSEWLLKANIQALKLQKTLLYIGWFNVFDPESVQIIHDAIKLLEQDLTKLEKRDIAGELRKRFSEAAKAIQDGMAKTVKQGTPGGDARGNALAASIGKKSELEDATKQATDFIDELTKKYKTFGQTVEQIKFSELMAAGAPKHLMGQIRVLLDRLRAAGRTAAIEPIASAARPAFAAAMQAGSQEAYSTIVQHHFGSREKEDIRLQRESLKTEREQTGLQKQMVEKLGNKPVAVGLGA